MSNETEQKCDCVGCECMRRTLQKRASKIPDRAIRDDLMEKLADETADLELLEIEINSKLAGKFQTK